MSLRDFSPYAACNNMGECQDHWKIKQQDKMIEARGILSKWLKANPGQHATAKIQRETGLTYRVIGILLPKYKAYFKTTRLENHAILIERHPDLVRQDQMQFVGV